MRLPELLGAGGRSSLGTGTLGLALAWGQLLFWVYALVYLWLHADPRGDGMEFVALGPLGFIVVVFAGPVLLFRLAGRRPILSLILGVVGTCASALLWIEILGELG